MFVVAYIYLILCAYSGIIFGYVLVPPIYWVFLGAAITVDISVPVFVIIKYFAVEVRC